MSVNRIFLPFIASFIVITPGFGGDIVSCDSFEMCADGNPPLTNYVLELEAKVTELEEEIVASKNDFSGKFYENRDLSGLRFRYANFANAELRYVSLRSADLTGADFTGAKIYDCNFIGGSLADAILIGVDWRDTQCPDGSNTDTNGLGYCLPINGMVP